MHEPEQSQSFWQTRLGYSGLNANIGITREKEQIQEFQRWETEGNEQGQKIYPQRRWYEHYKEMPYIIRLSLPLIGFMLAFVGFWLSSIVLNYANGRADRLAEGTLGQIGSVIVMLLCLVLFIVALIRSRAQVRGNGYGRQILREDSFL